MTCQVSSTPSRRQWEQAIREATRMARVAKVRYRVYLRNGQWTISMASAKPGTTIQVHEFRPPLQQTPRRNPALDALRNIGTGN